MPVFVQDSSVSAVRKRRTLYTRKEKVEERRRQKKTTPQYNLASKGG